MAPGALKFNIMLRLLPALFSLFPSAPRCSSSREQRLAKRAEKKSKEDEATRKAAEADSNLRDIAAYEDSLARGLVAEVQEKSKRSKPKKGVALATNGKPVTKPKRKPRGKKAGATTEIEIAKTDSAGAQRADGTSSPLSDVPSDVEQAPQDAMDLDKGSPKLSAKVTSVVEPKQKTKKKKEKPSKTLAREQIESMCQELMSRDGHLRQTSKQVDSRGDKNPVPGNDVAAPGMMDNFTSRLDQAAWNVHKTAGSRTRSSKASSTATHSSSATMRTTSSVTSADSRASIKRTVGGRSKVAVHVDEEESDPVPQGPSKKVKSVQNEPRSSHTNRRTVTLDKQAVAAVDNPLVVSRLEAPMTALPKDPNLSSRVVDDGFQGLFGPKSRKTANDGANVGKAGKNVSFAGASTARILSKTTRGDQSPSQLPPVTPVPTRGSRTLPFLKYQTVSDNMGKTHQTQPKQKKQAVIAFDNDEDDEDDEEENDIDEENDDEAKEPTRQPRRLSDRALMSLVSPYTPRWHH
ncbi:hypothetical protein CERSUDRAFT_78682 [Gelatoporia subvermispora B]|uniref:DNA replication regulator SLD2 n=1 Tax=Ceriporiopsis subvermispora (strain B) TaxID=914234 RepID=M2Q1I4_CERS8|nr:hypothetical protein CERSUDRAFT_78682 [Gelatoporia subvermispora B]